MRIIAVLPAILLSIAFSPQVTAAPVRAAVSRLPPGAEQQVRRLRPYLGPRSRAFVASEAARIVKTGDFSQAEVRANILNADLGIGGGGDIDLLLQSIMFQVAQDCEDELRDEIGAMKQALARKQRQRGQVVAGRRERTGGNVQAVAAMNLLQAPSAPVDSRAHGLGAFAAGRGSLDGQIDEDQADLNSLGDLSEEEQLRLQTLTDSREKALETMSNIMKKAADTRNAIVQNLK